jgi:hypothetical protein
LFHRRENRIKQFLVKRVRVLFFAGGIRKLLFYEEEKNVSFFLFPFVKRDVREKSFLV